ncbi:queuosine precursor transporter [Devosia rhizoryzae]|uniref:Probable queuosine precursor transporter n=2 Tax=Devosia rhizoryzae TaxID=2774137 RepID=A0ABX7C869_9HYPH|nr:queuosine precursor transporter [Devosia rhizoryzae]
MPAAACRKNSPMLSRFLVAVAAMVATVAASNVLVQFPVQFTLGSVNLGDILTWGAFTYPVAFLVTDLTNRAFGPQKTRLVVVAGFAVAVLLSIWLATPRIAIASGAAFLVAQLLDVSIFHRLRNGAWWHAPMFSSLVSSALDTVIFFTLAMAPAFAGIDRFFGMEDSSLAFPAPLLGIGPEVELWQSLALGDFLVKLIMALALLAPYKTIRDLFIRRMPNPA